MADAGSIVTVEGPIAPDDLGITLTHEHTFIDMMNWYTPAQSAVERQIANEPLSIENLSFARKKPHKDNYLLGSKEDAIEEVGKFYQAGGRTIVDVTPKNTGRDPEQVRAVGRASNVQYVHGTAYYVRSAHPDYLDGMSIEDIETEFIDDIKNGIGESDVRAGLVGEIGLSADEQGEMYDEEERVLRAGARAARKTGAALSIHPPGRLERAQRGRTYPTSRWCLDVLDIVEEEGLSADRVVMGHMDRTLYEDMEYMLELAERGPYLEFDLWGTDGRYMLGQNDGYPSDHWRMMTVAELIKEGHTSQLLFAHDICTKDRLLKYGGDGYAHILKTIVPMISNFGVTEDHIERILIDNPKRVLTFDSPA